MKRKDVLYEVVNFGRFEEHELIAKHKFRDAYQIERARTQMIYYLFEHSMKDFKKMLHSMFYYTINEDDHWEYKAGYFVADNTTRILLISLYYELFKNSETWRFRALEFWNFKNS